MCNLNKILNYLEELLKYRKTLIWLFSAIVSMFCYFIKGLEPVRIFFLIFLSSIMIINFLISILLIIQGNIENEFIILKILLMFECIIATYLVIKNYNSLVWSVKEFAIFQIITLLICMFLDSLVFKNE